MAEIKVLLVDDHEVVRAGLRAMIDAQPDMTTVGEAGTGEEGVRRVGYDSPDVVVLDVRLPDGSGVEACREIRSRFPEV
jgi:DNA-binding NarL/FixJ family response regulator